MFDSAIHGSFGLAKIAVLAGAGDTGIAREMRALLTEVYSFQTDQVITYPIAELAAVVEQPADCNSQSPLVLVLLSLRGVHEDLATIDADCWQRLASVMRVPPTVVLLDDLQVASLPPLLSQQVPVHLRDRIEIEQMLGTIAGELGIEHVLSLTALQPRLARLTQYRTESTLADERRRRRLRLRVGFSGALAAALAAYGTYRWVVRSSEIAAQSTQFDFEHDSGAWEASTSEGVRACTELALSASESHFGHQSLRITVDLDPNDASKHQGEVFVDLAKQLSAGAIRSIDLTNKTVTAWLKIPSELAGDDTNPNGAQLFVKDRAGRSQYGRWENLRARDWQRVEVAVGQAKNGEFINTGFAPTEVSVIGLKIAAGSRAKRKHSGFVYLDSVDWIAR